MFVSSEAVLVLERLEKEAQTYSVPEGSPGHEGVWTPDGQIRYWQVLPTTGGLLHYLAKGKKAKAILELGCSAGYSSIWLGLAAVASLGKVHTVDMAQAKVNMARQNILEAGLDNAISVYHMNALKFLELNNQKYDFVFLDADENYIRYFYHINEILEPGGLLIADNAVNYKYLMKDFLETISNSMQDRGSVYHIDNGLAIYEKIN
ncbi:O-methyltransferase [Microseira wollei]|uniref:O-methyltransferase family protein n=1 Tax=Microseira wollei NIES-4236 TaxID=2530354 RepID=A0AAV3XTS9_9CYAN|nr:class I SAM-dependent methyltransferase [Microseira wollei]GET44407.1 O-methyltransferase family protein [Microseira wollei NIES-4236]